MQVCPFCGGGLVERYSAAQMEREIALRSNFVRRRFDHRPDRAELTDLTEFMHGGPAPLLLCRRCSLLLRDDPAPARYEEDSYDPAWMRAVYPRYLAAFRRRARVFRALLRPHAEVLELGSHLGAFLQAAEESDWRATGLDIGEAAAGFARSQGLRVKRVPLEDYSPGRRADALFIWNCFEQLDYPAAALRHSHRLLKKHGLLVVRVPNARFHSRAALRQLGYNNLLGFPYRFGYTAQALEMLLRREGFQPVLQQGSRLIAVPQPDMPRWVRRESARVLRAAPSEAQDAPWIEIAARAA